MPNPQRKPPVILASSSPYRRELLARLGLTFECQSPAIDEAPQPGEAPAALAARLAAEKAAAVSAQQTAPSLIIASDQVAGLGQGILGKPGSPERAIQQLTQCSGQQVLFYTALTLHHTGTKQSFHRIVTTDVQFRRLSDRQITSYVAREKPLDCAGSFKVEGLGISLFESVTSSDPTALVGLPLIALCDGLSAFGIEVV